MAISTERLSTEYLEINSCARQVLSDRDYTMSRPHGRVDYHILYITSGICRVALAEEEKQVTAGNIILFRPYEPQQYAFLAQDGSVSSYIHFSGTGCETLLKKLGLYDEQIIEVGKNDRLERIFARMEREFAVKAPFFTETCASFLMQFLALAARLRTDKGRAGFRIERAVSAMYSDYADNRSVADYARLCHLSESRFRHVFREEMGCSPKDFLLQMKLDNALELLCFSDMPLTEISEAVGIGDYNYFCRIIKQRTGKTPGSLRKGE